MKHQYYTAPPADFRPKPVYTAIKRLIDLIAALCGVIVLSPVLIGIAIAIWADDHGPVLYKSNRVGLNGRPIQVYKFRSMKMGADKLEDMLTPEELAEYRINFKLEVDPRITKVGGFLRKTSLDELPQLLNIIGGSLSLVGPRPVLQEETELYGDDRALLLACKPGLTGLWQACGRSNVTYSDGARQALELRYVRQRGFLLDLKVLFWTVGAVVRMDGAR